MKTFAMLFLTALLATAAGCSKKAEPAPPQAPLLDDQGRELDPTTGVVRAEGWELVAANCVACHSARQFLRQRGTKATWQYIIDWMQQTQGLWQFPEGVEGRIVDYLAANYGPTGAYRRAPIPATLMPPNPYASDIRKQVEDMKARGALPNAPDKNG